MLSHNEIFIYNKHPRLGSRQRWSLNLSSSSFPFSHYLSLFVCIFVIFLFLSEFISPCLLVLSCIYWLAFRYDEIYHLYKSHPPSLFSIKWHWRWFKVLWRMSGDHCEQLWGSLHPPTSDTRQVSFSKLLALVWLVLYYSPKAVLKTLVCLKGTLRVEVFGRTRFLSGCQRRMNPSFLIRIVIPSCTTWSGS